MFYMCSIMFYWVSLRTLYPRLLEEGSEMQKCLTLGAGHNNLTKNIAKI